MVALCALMLAGFMLPTGNASPEELIQKNYAMLREGFVVDGEDYFVDAPATIYTNGVPQATTLDDALWVFAEHAAVQGLELEKLVDVDPRIAGMGSFPLVSGDGLIVDLNLHFALAVSIFGSTSANTTASCAGDWHADPVPAQGLVFPDEGYYVNTISQGVVTASGNALTFTLEDNFAASASVNTAALDDAVSYNSMNLVGAGSFAAVCLESAFNSGPGFISIAFDILLNLEGLIGALSDDAGTGAGPMLP